MKFNFQYQEEDINSLLDINDQINRPLYGMISTIFLIISFLLIKQLTANSVWISVLISIFISIIFSRYYRKIYHDLVIKTFKQSPKLSGPQNIIISESGIRKIDPISDCYYEYRMFNKVWVHSRGILLEIPQKTFIIIPKREFSSSEEYEQTINDLKTKVNKEKNSGSNTKKVFMFMGMFILLLTFMGLVSCLGATSYTDEVDDFESALSSIEDPNNEIIAYDKLDQGALVFYKELTDPNSDDSMLKVTFIPQQEGDWVLNETSSGYTRNENTEFQGNYALPGPGQPESSPFPVVYGEIFNHEIEKIEVLMEDNSDNNDIVDTKILSGDELTIWYSLVEETSNLEAVGKDSKGDQIATETISDGTVGVSKFISTFIRVISSAVRAGLFVLCLVVFWLIMVIFRQFMRAA